jgi:tetratricopeptide (TPR) repeat protein
LDKSIQVRRKAQQLARDGQIQRAISEMDVAIQTGEVDPYDHVFHGDLLVRGNRLEDAISAFQEAVSAYERVGLFRNAIAVGKKILRADPTRARTYQRLGELYGKEGLVGDSISYYLTFLDKSGEEVSGEEFLETLEKVATITGPKVEVALRLSDLCLRVGRQDRAATLLDDVARQAEEGGSTEIAETLRAHSQELRVGLPEAPDEPVSGIDGTEGTTADASPPFEEGVNFGTTVELSTEEPPAEDKTISQPLSNVENTGAYKAQEMATSAVPPITSLKDEIRTETEPQIKEKPSEEEPSEEPDSHETGGDLDVPRGPGLEEDLEEAIHGHQWAEAYRLCEEQTENAPGDRAVAEKLVYAARQMKDTLALVRGLVHLGDLKITAEDLEGALGCYLEIVELDPSNELARRRLARFRDLRVPGAEQLPGDLVGSTSEDTHSAQPTVSVRDDDMEADSSGEWVDLTSLIEDFREGVKNQIDPQDYTGHYDLGVSHQEMGLMDAALEEFDRVLIVKDLPPDVEIKTREMRASCFQGLARYREAIHECRCALDVPGRPEEERKGLFYQLACALVEVGETSEAEEILEQLAEADLPHIAAKEHLERLRGSSC